MGARLSSFSLSVVLGTVLTTVLGVAVVWPRFQLRQSMVDDWSAISMSPGQVHDLVRLVYHETGRFRPGFASWNYLQWYTLDGPNGMIGPNIWAVARIALLAGGLVTFTALALQGRKALPPVWTFVLVLLPSVVVLSTPAFGVDLARFGPQEPALVGGMTLGGSLIVLGMRIVAGSSRGLRAAALLVPGYVLWLYGVYQKESAVCAFVLVPFLLLGAPDLKRRVHDLGGPRRHVLAVLAAAAVLPVLHVGWESIKIRRQGDLIYGMDVQAKSKALTLFGDALDKMSSALGSRIGWLLVGVVLVGIAVSAVRRRVDWLALGLFLTAGTALLWSAQSGFAASRYFMPTIALLAVAAALVIGSIGREALRIAAVAVLALPCVWSLAQTGARVGVEKWAAVERQENRFVAAVRGEYRSGCPVVVSGLDAERTLALPVLVKLDGGRRRTCAGSDFFLILNVAEPDTALSGACAPGGGRSLGSWQLALERVELRHCSWATPGSEPLLRMHRLT